MNKRYSWLLFDADGTLLDYNAAERHSLNRAAARLGFHVDESIHRLYRLINSALWADFERGTVSSAELRIRRFHQLSDSLGWDVPAEDFSHVYLEELGNSGDVIPGALEILDSLPSSMERAIVTNGIRDTQFGRLRRSGLLGRFPEIVVSEDAGAAKPHPQFFDYTLDRIGFFDRESILMIGDSLSSDIAGGKGYGIDTCWFNPEAAPNLSGIEPDYEIRDLAELLGLVTG